MANNDPNQPKYTPAQLQAIMGLASSAQQQGRVAANDQDAWQHAINMYQQNPNMLNYMSVPGTNNQLSLGQVGQALSAFGGGASQGQTGQASTSASGGPFTDATNAAGRLGAAALGMAQIVNPTPGQIPAGSKGGVAQVASPIVSSDVPNAPAGPWNTTAGVMANQQQAAAMQNWSQHGGTGNPADAAAVEKQYGLAPGTVAQQFGTAATPNPSTTPNAQGQLPGTPTPTTPANAAGSAPATPWATAPPAPGAQAQPQGPIDWGAVAAHNTGLENAGKAIYEHLTGNDPSKATDAHINAFHDQLTQHIGNFFGGGGTPFGQAPQGAANYTAGVQPGVAATGATPMTALGVTPLSIPGAAPTKMASGGLVPGRGNQDTVPALLTPGEYVIPKAQAAQIFGGRAPVRMADGGFVPPETRRQRIAPPGSPPAAPSSQGQPSGQQQGSGQSANPDPTSYQGNNTFQWAQLAQQARAAQAANANVGSGGPGSIDSLGTLGDESLITGQGGPGQPGGPGSATMAASGAISDLANGLTKAAQTYAASFKPWQMQAKQFGNQGTPNYQNTDLQQDEVT
jgi:hypothetical protein